MSKRRSRSWSFLASRYGTLGTRWRNYRYLTVEPSARAQARLREKLRHLTRAGLKHSLADTVAAVATLLRGWKAYFQYGYPRRIFRRLNYHVQVRFRCYLRNRSHRRSRPFRQGESLYAGLQRYGLQVPVTTRLQLLVWAL